MTRPPFFSVEKGHGGLLTEKFVFPFLFCMLMAGELLSPLEKAMGVLLTEKFSFPFLYCMLMAGELSRSPFASFRASFCGRWRPEKFTRNPHHFSMQNSQANSIPPSSRIPGFCISFFGDKQELAEKRQRSNIVLTVSHKECSGGVAQ